MDLLMFIVDEAYSVFLRAVFVAIIVMWLRGDLS